jgi:hypothetical protein
MARTAKSTSRKRSPTGRIRRGEPAKRVKATRKIKQPPKPLGEPEKILFHVEGKMSTFGGPLDFGMQPDEGLALFGKLDLEDPKYAYLFLPAPPPRTSGLGRRLNPNKFYFACRWNYSDTPKEFLRRSLACVKNPQNGRTADARPVDWGPHESTGRVADLSPGLAAALGLNTDDVVSITISARRAIPVKTARVRRAGHGSSSPHVKPVIKEFKESPNHSSRNGAKIDMVVLHCTESSLTSTLAHFQTPGRKNPVSAHYVIDRNGDIYQMVRDSDSAWHCMGANKSSIGIEHVGGEHDQLAGPQAAASAALIRWLIEQYNIPRTNIFGHDFTPGYCRPGGTSCPDKLFGAAHAQTTIVAWVAANV